MQLQSESLDENKIARKSVEGTPISLEKDSIQYNAQELQQEQRVDVNPMQHNAQNLHIHIENDYSAKMTGTTYLEKNNEIAKNASIYLFFGNESENPVYRTNSDDNGNFVIEQLPPGYYTMVVQLGGRLKYKSHYIKVLPRQNVHLSVLLRRKPYIEL